VLNHPLGRTKPPGLHRVEGAEMGRNVNVHVTITTLVARCRRIFAQIASRQPRSVVRLLRARRRARQRRLRVGVMPPATARPAVLRRRLSSSFGASARLLGTSSHQAALSPRVFTAVRAPHGSPGAACGTSDTAGVDSRGGAKICHHPNASYTQDFSLQLSHHSSTTSNNRQCATALRRH